MEDGISVLRVLVTTALGAEPVPGAVVTVSAPADEAGNSTLLYATETDRSGMTPPMELAALPRAASLAPGGGRPFALYTVQADHPDFTPLAAVNVTAFSGVPAVLPLALTPLPEARSAAPQQLTARETPQALYQKEE